MTAIAHPRSSAARIGWVVALLVLALDQATKYGVLLGLKLTEGGPGVALAPFAEARLVWNHGISYGLFQQNSDFGRWLLVAISVAAAIGLGVWLTRTTSLFVALAIGLIFAGALGNAIDRAIYGAVCDFIYLYTPDRTFRWYVFNVADAAIVAGVIGLLYDSLIRGRRAAA
jgi:signal peptidase II